VVAICDHLVLFALRKPKHKVFREPLTVAFYLLVEPLGCHAMKRSKVGIKHDLQRANQKNLVRDTLGWTRENSSISGRTLLPVTASSLVNVSAL
jgi:hypothetical protein